MPIHKKSLFKKVFRFLKKPLPEQANLVHDAFYILKARIYYRHVFGSFGSGSVLFKPIILSHPRFIHIGKNVTIRQGARLEVIVLDPDNPPELKIGDNVNIEQNVHIICHSKVTIGKDVSISGNCAIVDVTHPYENVSDPTKIGDRISPSASTVEIGERSLLGFGVVVLPDVNIGTYCVVGAQSLVTKDMPHYSVVAGSPARVLRSFDPTSGTWVAAPSAKGSTHVE